MIVRLATALFAAALEPYLALISRWIFRGVVTPEQDPTREFPLAAMSNTNVYVAAAAHNDDAAVAGRNVDKEMSDVHDDEEDEEEEEEEEEVLLSLSVLLETAVLSLED